MKEFFSISRAAKSVGMTAETLRHYDRIGLVKPCKTDEWTGYRYYSQQEIVKLNTIRALQCMGLTLAEINEILSYDDFNKIVRALREAEQNADKKIEELNNAKLKIRRARAFYENKSDGVNRQNDAYIKFYPRRVIMLSESLDKPTVDNLWNYHRHFYSSIPENMKDKFTFEDSAGVYEREGQARLFTECRAYTSVNGLEILPEGKYLCADCTEENRVATLENLISTAKNSYNVKPKFTVRLIVLSGILQWNYLAQVFIGE